MRVSRVIAVIGILAVLFMQLGGAALAGSYDHEIFGSAPEIDPSLIGSGLALLGGSFLLLVERYRRRS
jgi:hypothetical protein